MCLTVEHIWWKHLYKCRGGAASYENKTDFLERSWIPGMAQGQNVPNRVEQLLIKVCSVSNMITDS